VVEVCSLVVIDFLGNIHVEALSLVDTGRVASSTPERLQFLLPIRA
jgi:hypothetical protein